MLVNSTEWRELVRRQAEKAGVELTPSMVDQFTVYISELLSWNLKINLTAITDPQEVAEKHIIDSLVPARYIPENASLLDIGSGGGFPGIPLKILQPSISVCMVDSVRKKISFLKYVIGLLSLKNISAHHSRIDELAFHPEFAGQFDVIISRAFASLYEFLALALPFAKPDGLVIAMKGPDFQKEIEAIPMDDKRNRNGVYRLNSWRFSLRVERYFLPDSGGERALVMGKLEGT